MEGNVIAQMISSSAGLAASFEFMNAYAASKFALEGDTPLRKNPVRDVIDRCVVKL